MSRLDDVENELWNVRNEIEDLKAREFELEDERIQAEDEEAAERECERCEGKGWIEIPATDEEMESDDTCPVCGGTGENVTF